MMPRFFCLFFIAIFFNLSAAQQPLQWQAMHQPAPKILAGSVYAYDSQTDIVWFIGGGNPNVDFGTLPQSGQTDYTTIWSFRFQTDFTGVWDTYPNLTWPQGSGLVTHLMEGQSNGMFLYQKNMYYWNYVVDPNQVTDTNAHALNQFNVQSRVYTRFNELLQNQQRAAWYGPCVVNDMSGNVFYIGGSNESPKPSDIPMGFMNVFNIPSRTWNPGSDLSVPRSRHACVLHNNIIYAFGGVGSSNLVLNTLETYTINPQFQNQWQQTPWNQQQAQMVHARHSFRAVIHLNQIYLLSGFSQYPQSPFNPPAITVVEVYDPIQSRFVLNRASPLPSQQTQALAVIQRKNRIYYFGGGFSRQIFYSQAHGAPTQQGGGSWTIQPTYAQGQWRPPTMQPTMHPGGRGFGGISINSESEGITAYFITMSIIMCLLFVALICLVSCFWCYYAKNGQSSGGYQNTHDRANEDE